MISALILCLVLVIPQMPVSSLALSWRSTDNFENEYQFGGSETKKNFGDARQFCENQNGSSLPQFPSKHEQEWVFTYVSLGSDFWLNSISVPFTKEFKGWADGTKFNYTAWANNRPDDDDVCNAIAMRDGQWDDTECSKTYRIVCQRSKMMASLLGKESKDEQVNVLEKSINQMRIELTELQNVQTFSNSSSPGSNSIDGLIGAMTKFFLHNANNASRIS